MKYRCDWGSLRRTGLGWRVLPNLLVMLAFFLPNVILFPVYYVIFGYPEFFWTELIRSSVLVVLYIALGLYFVKLIAYAEIQLDEIVKPYGVSHDYVKLLFRNELEYLKWSKKFVFDTMSYKLFAPGLVMFLLFFGISIFGFIDAYIHPETYQTQIFAPLPVWTNITVFISNCGLALLFFLIIGFFGVVIYGLFKIGELSVPYKMEKKKGNINYQNALDKKLLAEKKRSILSIYGYAKMITKIQVKLTEAQLTRKRIDELFKGWDNTGKTYYEFQRGNRRIGEFLFNIATILIILCIAAAIIMWVLSISGVLVGLEANIFAFSVALFIFALLSFGIFLFPQINLHRYLKDFKFELIDSFSFILSRLEYLYFEAMTDPTILTSVDMKWDTREALLKDMEFIKATITDVKSYGTWSYDFPEIMMLIAVALSTAIPLFLSFL